MHINYLILAHDNFRHLDRLIEALHDTESRFFIHIDRKTAANYHTLSAQVDVLTGQSRVKVNWGSFGMIQATINLMQQAALARPADYYILLSGADYPIRSRAFLQHVLSSGHEFINILPAPLPHKPLSRFEHVYFDYNRRRRSVVSSLMTLLEKTLAALRITRTIPFQLYAGSQWFALTGPCVDHILRTLDTDKSYVRFFRYALIPDEAFFHTIIGNSAFAASTHTSLTYTDWSTGPGPAVLTDHHIDLFEAQTAFEGAYGTYTPVFARKFDATNADLLARIAKKCHAQ
jgi:hypothetical protein